MVESHTGSTNGPCIYSSYLFSDCYPGLHYASKKILTLPPLAVQCCRCPASHSSLRLPGRDPSPGWDAESPGRWTRTTLNRRMTKTKPGGSGRSAGQIQQGTDNTAGKNSYNVLQGTYYVPTVRRSCFNYECSM